MRFSPCLSRGTLLRRHGYSYKKRPDRRKPELRKARHDWERRQKVWTRKGAGKINWLMLAKY
jgi:hypothetical protein